MDTRVCMCVCVCVSVYYNTAVYIKTFNKTKIENIFNMEGMLLKWAKLVIGKNIQLAKYTN